MPARKTLEQLGVPRRTFCRWYDHYLEGGPEALEDRPSAPSRVWNRIPADIHDQISEPALDQSELSPRELAVRFTDEQRYFVSEVTVFGGFLASRKLANCGPCSQPGICWRCSCGRSAKLSL